jgi:hypothetical protein
MPDVTSDLQAESIIPDILAAGTIVPRNLRVEFPNARLEKPGQMIDREATQPKPSVFVDPPVRSHPLGVSETVTNSPCLSRRMRTRQRFTHS